MIGKIGNILNAAQSAIVQSIKRTETVLDKVQLHLASGKDVNSALDNPSNFFISRSLSQKASDLMRLLDDISTSIGAIKAANTGAEAILRLIDQADALLDEAAIELYSGEHTALVSSLSDTDISAILAANPGVIYSTDTQSFYRLGAPANWTVANAAAQAATLVQPVGVTGVAGVTGHLTNITSQIENDFVNALAPGNAWIGGSDAGVEGEWRWTSGPEAGQQFWQGLAGGSTVGGSYARWGGGEPNNSGNEDYVHMRADGFWNDQPGNTAYNYIIEWDSSLFVSTVDEDLAARAVEYAEDYQLIMDQIDLLAKDTHYRGIGMLRGDTLRTDFNPERTSFLTTEGIVATSHGLGLADRDFLRFNTLTLAQEQIDEARLTMRSYMATLAVDFSIISIRLDFTQRTINTHTEGARELVIVDEQQAGAELLALQVRQQLQMEALRLSTQSSIDRLFS
jgi:hypothetical protein